MLFIRYPAYSAHLVRSSQVTLLDDMARLFNLAREVDGSARLEWCIKDS
jgi:hypothetical protein